MFRLTTATASAVTATGASRLGLRVGGGSVAAYSSDSFKEKESAHENQYVHEHDAEQLTADSSHPKYSLVIQTHAFKLIAKLRKDLAKKTTEQAAASAALEAAIDAAPKVSPIDVAYGSGARTGNAFAKKEGAAEEKFFRDQDKEKLEKLRKQE
ncbi:hypothetical protein HK100_005620 [Physocladia obscura]|uniref:ATPase inhibitor, mitochondrial n=1 Tax=Physocladia obscura TaxID=109957 RepID=A0AAD5XGE1_9FUNG|nr:hypothetical protein HK100_005620 [Physocladia obscura]